MNDCRKSNFSLSLTHILTVDGNSHDDDKDVVADDNNFYFRVLIASIDDRAQPLANSLSLTRFLPKMVKNNCTQKMYKIKFLLTSLPTTYRERNVYVRAH
jgi:hypothetical protein